LVVGCIERGTGYPSLFLCFYDEITLKKCFFIK
jgi:hypothetical protein